MQHMTEPLTAAAVAPYPEDPADLFVTLYDELPEPVFCGWDAQDWFADRSVRDLAGKICEAILDYGELAPEDVARIIARDGDRGRFTILLGIDDALQFINPYALYHQEFFPSLYGLAGRYQSEHRLNTKATTGLLLPRCAFPCRPIAKREKDEFFRLHRITAEQAKVVEHSVLSHVLDAALPPETPVPVGCAPLLETYDDVDITFGHRGGVATYRLGPVDSPGLRTRIKQVIRKLDESGAHLAVMPEATLNDQLLEYWKNVAFDTAEYDRSAHPLRYLLLGSGPLGRDDPPPNRAVLIDRWTRKEILVHDKLAWFTMEKKRHLDGWRVPGAPEEGPVEEYIRRGTKVRTVDTSLGRLSILVCEDLGRPIRWERELRACGVSHLLVPIFSKPIFEHRWEEAATGTPLTTLGSWVVIANSKAVGHVIPAEEMKGERYTCLIAGPDTDDKGHVTYDTVRQFGAAPTGDELGRVKVNLDGVESSVLPTVQVAALQPEWHALPDLTDPPD
jgi:predicted amidohydrolase